MEWIETSIKLPPENVTVETKIEDDNGCRNAQNLIRKGSLWYLDNGMYVYYTPTHWRYRNERQKRMYELPPPTYIDYSFDKMSGMCGCGMVEQKEKTDCYFYHEEYDMGARIDICSYYDKLGDCPCEGCDKYIKKSEVFEMVKKYINNKESEE